MNPHQKDPSRYMDGAFRAIKLSDCKGKWVVMCFHTNEGLLLELNVRAPVD
jgi:hypothetical protein